jgi:hypothetical protein
VPEAGRRRLISELLRDGALILSPSAEAVAEAERLARLRLIEIAIRRVVHCANTVDQDFPPAARDCDGFVELRDDAHEGSADYRCPLCERVLYPEADRKAQTKALSVRLSRSGIEQYLIKSCGDLTDGRSFNEGILQFPVNGLNAVLCLVDYCSDERWLARGFGVNQRCVYVTVDRYVGQRMMVEEAVLHVPLVDLILAEVDLRDFLLQRASALPPALMNADVSVYSLGARPIRPFADSAVIERRSFRVAMSAAGLHVDGIVAIKRQRRESTLKIFAVLIQEFTEALIRHQLVQGLSADDIADRIEPSSDEAVDASSVTRTINRLRGDIATAVRRELGKPIADHDIIETVARADAADVGHGYRLNPKSVVLGPYEN